MKFFRLLKIVKLYCLLALLPASVFSQNAKQDSFYVANWNVENLFDTEKDSLKNDSEFLPGTVKDWNVSRFDQKLDHLTQVINYMNNGCGPDIFSVEEVENLMVMKYLSYKFTDREYIACHRDSPDERGIDVGLYYDRKVFSVDSIAAIHVKLPDNRPTRDILHVILTHKLSGEKINIYVNHWPSRRGGELKSESNRIAAAEVLKSSLDTLFSTSPDSKVIVLGDFNDNPDNNSVVGILGAKKFDCSNNNTHEPEFINLSYTKFEKGEGSYLYRGKFEMIDQMIISKNLLGRSGIFYSCGTFDVVKPPFMIFKEGKRTDGAIPTYEGSKYIGGYSDHFPVGAKFYVKGN